MAEVETKGQSLSVRRQCQLLNVSRSQVYYKKRPETALNQLLLRRIAELHQEHPGWGSRKQASILSKELNISVNRKRVVRLRQQLEIKAIMPKRKLSQPGVPNYRFPYLVQKQEIVRSNQVWCTDIT